MRTAQILLLFLAAVVCSSPLEAAITLRRWSWSAPESPSPFGGDLHYAFGRDLGAEFGDEIGNVMKSNENLQNTLIPTFVGPNASKEFRDVYETFLVQNNRTFPRYVSELKGIADGSGVAFSSLFLNQMSEEFSYFISSSKPEIVDEHCTDVAWGHHLVHNEDEGAFYRNHTVLITAHGLGVRAFTAYTYLGETPTGAFGWNSNQIAFTMNYVGPSKAFRGGLGRTFVARDLLEANSFDDAVQRAVRLNQCAGHNYQIASFGHGSPRLANLEVASFGQYALKDLSDGEQYFHVNQYQLLNISQIYSNSSLHRYARITDMLASRSVESVTDLFSIVGDQHDRQWPVYHDETSHARGDLSDWTLVTVHMDLISGSAHFYESNPKTNDPVFTTSMRF